MDSIFFPIFFGYFLDVFLILFRTLSVFEMSFLIFYIHIFFLFSDIRWGYVLYLILNSSPGLNGLNLHNLNFFYRGSFRSGQFYFDTINFFLIKIFFWKAEINYSFSHRLLNEALTFGVLQLWNLESESLYSVEENLLKLYEFRFSKRHIGGYERKYCEQ